jgi:hypothetical protein
VPRYADNNNNNLQEPLKAKEREKKKQATVEDVADTYSGWVLV